MLTTLTNFIVNRLDARSGSDRYVNALAPSLVASDICDNSEAADALAMHICEDADLIVDDDTSWSIDIPSRQHLRWAALVLATLRTLRSANCDEQATLAFITTLNAHAGKPLFPRLTALFLSHFARRQRRIFQLFITAMLPHYELGWHFRAQPGESGGINVSVKRCFYHSFFSLYGEPQLIVVFCALNDQWTRFVRSPWSRKRFDSTKSWTLPKSGADCRFVFVPIRVSAGDKSG